VEARLTMTNNVQVYEDEADDFRWRYEHENTKILADSGQGYSRRIDLLAAVDTVFSDPPRVFLPDGTEHILPSSTAVKSALALLSMITGDAWDEAKLINEAENLRAIAKATLRARHGMTSDDAEAVVEERWQAYAAPIVADEAPADPGTVQSPVTPTPPTAEELVARSADYMARRTEAKTPDPSEEKSGVASGIESLRAAKERAQARSARRNRD
jgi:uncharacterized protein YegP (UPF0339 family)